MCGGIRMMISRVGLLLVMELVGLAALTGCKSKQAPPLPVASVSAEQPVAFNPPAPTPPKCRLTVPRTQLGTIVFPTLNGAKEFDNAVVSQDTGAANAALRANLGYEVPRLTSCSKIDLVGSFGELSYAKVRIIEGEFSGRVGWVPDSQTAGN
jgi:hypothetical protein